MKRNYATYTLIFLLSLSFTSFGQSINDDLDRQYLSIKSGLRNGSLTFNEHRILKRNHQNLTRYVDRLYFNDGRLSRAERRLIGARLDLAWIDIRRARRSAGDIYVQDRNRNRYDNRRSDRYRNDGWANRSTRNNYCP